MTTRIQQFDYSINLLRALLWQDNTSPRMTSLLQQKQAWYDENVSTFWEDWVRDVFDIRTANEFGLTVWAIILGMPTSVIIPPTSKENFGFNSTIYTTPYQVSYPAEQPISALAVTNMFRTDWQGTLPMFNTARTNAILWSADLTNAAWPKQASGSGVVPVVTANAGVAPDGTLTADRVVFNKGAGVTATDYSRIISNVTTVAGNPYSQGVWLRSFDGVSTYTMQMSFNGQQPILVKVTPVWKFFSNSIAAASDTARIFRFDTQGSVSTSTTADILMWGGMQSPGLTLGRYIPTTTAAVTVTDYTVAGTGVITFGQPPTLDPTKDFIFWNGTYTTAAGAAIVATNRQIARTFKQGNKNFNNGNFGSNTSVVAGLTLEQKRILLRLRYFKLISRCTVPEINRMMKSLLGDQGSVYVLDANDMSFITYIFGFQPNSSLAFVLQNFDVLPRPAAVGVRYLVATRKTFGFGQFNKNFNNGTFGA